MNPREYASATPEELRQELCVHADFLVAEHIRLAGHLADHQRQFWHAYENSTGPSVAARTQDAQHAALADWCQVLETRGEINATLVRVETIRLLLGFDRASDPSTFPPDSVHTP